MGTYTAVQKDFQIIVGIKCRTSNFNAPDAGPHDIPKHWQKFVAEDVCSKISNKASDDILALYFECQQPLPKGRGL